MHLRSPVVPSVGRSAVHQKGSHNAIGGSQFSRLNRDIGRVASLDGRRESMAGVGRTRRFFSLHVNLRCGALRNDDGKPAPLNADCRCERADGSTGGARCCSC